MTEQTNEAPRRGRPPRVEEGQVIRRRRQSLGLDRHLKLHVPESMKDPEFTYRWVNDRPGRVHQLTKEDDWDRADISTPENGGEGTLETRVTDKQSGERAVLLRKRKDFYEADKKEEQRALDATDELMRRGAVQGPEGLDGSEAYIPGGGRGRQGRNTVSGK